MIIMTAQKTLAKAARKTSVAVLYDPAKTFQDNFANGPFPLDKKQYKDSGEPKFKFLGKPVHSPFGIPAGPLPTSRHIKYAFEQGFDVLVYKTQRTVPFDANKFPNVLYVDIESDLTLERASKPVVGRQQTNKPQKKLSITNSLGNPSKGPDFWVDDLKKALKYQAKGQLLIMSVVGTIQEGFGPEEYYDDFAEAAELAASTGVEAIEVNLSCPNVASEGVLCYTHDAVVSICKKAKQRIGDVPLIAKLGYFSADQAKLLEQIVKDISPYVSAIASINTISAPIVDDQGNQALPGEGRWTSGVCGASVKWAGLDMVKQLKALREKLNIDLEIIGVGGVMTPKDFHEYREAGADIVQSATGAMWNPNLAAEIKQSL